MKDFTGSEIATEWFNDLSNTQQMEVEKRYGMEWDNLSKLAKLLIYNDCKNSFFEDDDDYLTEAEKRSIYGDYQYQCLKEE